MEALRLNASIPLLQCLPHGYHPLSTVATPIYDDDASSQRSNTVTFQSPTNKKTQTSARRSIRRTAAAGRSATPSTRILRGTTLVNGISLVKSDDEGEIIEMQEAVGEVSAFEPSPPVSPDPTESDSEADDDELETAGEDHDGTASCSTTSISSSAAALANKYITYAPWVTLRCANDPSNQKSPWEMRRLAHGIAWMKRLKCQPDVPYLIPSFGPTCRIPFLPTAALCKFMLISYTSFHLVGQTSNVIVPHASAHTS